RSEVELRLGEKRGRLPENLIGALQFDILAFQVLQALTLVGRQPRSLARVTLGLSNPPSQGLDAASQLLANRSDRCPLRGMLCGVIKHHSDCSLPQLWGVLWWSCHGAHPL